MEKKTKRELFEECKNYLDNGEMPPDFDKEYVGVEDVKKKLEHCFDARMLKNHKVDGREVNKFYDELSQSSESPNDVEGFCPEFIRDNLQDIGLGALDVTKTGPRRLGHKKSEVINQSEPSKPFYNKGDFDIDKFMDSEEVYESISNENANEIADAILKAYKIGRSDDVVKYKEFIQQLYYDNWINSNILSPNEFNNKIELELIESTDIKKIKIDRGKNNDA